MNDRTSEGEKVLGNKSKVIRNDRERKKTIKKKKIEGSERKRGKK